jgi:phenylalanyl-tRNA synthetase beta chain
MNISRQWLEAFLRRSLDSRDVATRLAMLGAPVDAIEPVGTDLSAFVVGLVTEVHPHPNADKLRVTTVDDGSGTLFTVVCGAPNVVAGNRYPFARLGTVMPNGMMIERRKLRGEPSEGMLCSARELGLGQDHDGLMTLDSDAAPGTPLTDLVGRADERLLVDVTPNRADLLGHKGIARELAASLGVPYRLPEIPDEVTLDLPTPSRFTDEAAVGGIRVAIDDRDGCGRLLAAVIRGVTVKPSPAWLQQRLASVGVRSINNIVDATNYIMFELNQPMHAYDATTLHGPALIARTAMAAERLVTLDGVDRAIAPGALVMADDDRVIGIAGVLGGRDTEVRDTTTAILLECAWFQPARVRRSRRDAGLTTEASHRFERGTDRWGAVDALRRAVRLLVTVAGGELDGPMVDVQPQPVHPPRVFVRPARVAQVLGVELAWPEIEKQLVAIGATVVSKPDDARIAVDVPGWRPDISTEIDLIEEIARVLGYDRLPEELGRFRPGLRRDDPAWHGAASARQLLAGAGLAEVITLPMVATAGAEAPRVKNPLSSDHALLRDALLPALVGAVEANWAQQVADVRLFEVGTVFRQRAGAGFPQESQHAAFVMTGARVPAHWTDGGHTPLWDRWDARGLFETLLELAHPGSTIHVDEAGWSARNRADEVVGHCSQLMADAPAWAAPLFGGEVTMGGTAAAAAAFVPLPAYPVVRRDLALLVGLEQPIVAVVALLESRGARHGVVAVQILDEYRGKGLPDGKRSVTVRLTFRSPDRTLTDTEVEQALGRLQSALERELDVTLRTS